MMMMTTQKFSRERGKKQLQRRQICNFKEKQPKKKKRPKREKQNPQNAKEEEEEARFNIINSESFFLLATREERLLKGKKV